MADVRQGVDLVTIKDFRKLCESMGIKLPKEIIVSDELVNHIEWRQMPHLVKIDGKKTSKAPMITFKLGYRSWSDSNNKYHWNKVVVTEINGIVLKEDCRYLKQEQAASRITASERGEFKLSSDDYCVRSRYKWFVESCIRKPSLDKRWFYASCGKVEKRKYNYNSYLQELPCSHPKMASIKKLFAFQESGFEFMHRLASSPRAVQYRETMKKLREQQREIFRARKECREQGYGEGALLNAMNMDKVLTQDTLATL